MKKLGLSLWLSATKRMMPRDRAEEGYTFIWDGLRKSCCRVEKVELGQGRQETRGHQNIVFQTKGSKYNGPESAEMASCVAGSL